MSQPWILHCTQCNISCCNTKNKILQKPLLCYIILPIRASSTIVVSYGTRVHKFPFLAFLLFSLCINGCHNFLISLHISSLVIHHIFHHKGRFMCRVVLKDTLERVVGCEAMELCPSDIIEVDDVGRHKTHLIVCGTFTSTFIP